MINRQMLKHKVESLNDSEVAEVLEYINIMESVNEQTKSPDPLEEAILGLLLRAMQDEQAWTRQLLRRQRVLNN
jgi:hypothetical protein